MSMNERRGGRFDQELPGPIQAREVSGSPGKGTLTENLQRRLQPVETAAPVAEDPAALQATAAQGITGAGGLLPHHDTIQQSFGRHDVSGVQAHTGDAASQASGAIGAEAYATGNHVAFAGAPSLHTAAHEAAHVVQQKGGVQLKGGVGEAGDSYERHADAVADRVVAGQSAEALLDPYAGGAGGSALQLSMDLHKAGLNGSKGLRDIYQDSADSKLYGKLPSSTGTVWQLIEVTVVKEGGVDKYKDVVGAAKKPWDVATAAWVDPNAAPAPVVPVVPTGWSLAQIATAGFKKKAGTHYQRDEVNYLDYHVHVSAYQEANKEFTSFHVKFDPGSDHISWFYSFALGGQYEKPGQSEFNQKKIIKAFSTLNHATHKVPDQTEVDRIYGLLVDKSEAIAAVVRGLLV